MELSERTLSLLLAAGVSAFVTLLVELFAKPGLEVRKDRILDRARARRQASELALKAVLLCSAIVSQREALSNDVIRAEAKKQRDRLPEIGQELLDLTPRVALQLPADVRKALAIACGTMVSAPQSTQLHGEVVEKIMTLLPSVADYLAANNFSLRVLRLYQVRQALKSLEGPPA
jgi:hypothetical protein